MRVTCWLLAGSLSAVAISGCAYSSASEQEANACRVIGPKAMLGALGGAAGGAAVGAAAGGNGKAALIGAGVGLIAGLVAGHVSDKQDCEAAQTALAQNIQTARTGESFAWNSASGHSGQYTYTTDVFAAHNSDQCRRADSLGAGGEPSQSLVTCRMPDGNYAYYPT